MSFFNQLTKQLQKSIPLEIIDEILLYISIENLFRLGIDEEKLNYLAKFIPFENILEHPEVYTEYKYEDLRYNMSNIPNKWYGYVVNGHFEFFDRPIENIWFLCDPILFKCYIRYFPKEMALVLNNNEEEYETQITQLLFHLFFAHDRIDLLRLIPNDMLPNLFDRNIYSTIISKNNTICIALLEYVLDLNGYDAEINKLAMYYAVKDYKIDIVNWLIEHEQKWDSDTIDFIVQQGNIEMLMFLNVFKTDGSEGCTPHIMDLAAENGEFEIIKCLTETRLGSCTTYAMDGAASNGHLKIVKYLSENRTEGCTTNAIDGAARKGHYEIVKYHSENQTEGCTTNAMDWAAYYGHLQIVKYLSENRTEGCTTNAIDWASANGHFEIVKYLSENRTEGCTTNAIDGAARSGQFEIVKYHSENRTEGI